MTDSRTRIAVLVVVLGLGGLGGYALSANRKVAKATTAATPTTQVIRRTVHRKPKHPRAAGSSPGATASRSLTSAPVSTGSSGAASSSPPVSTGTSGSGGGGAVHTRTSGGGGGEGGGEHEGGDAGGD